MNPASPDAPRVEQRPFDRVGNEAAQKGGAWKAWLTVGTLVVLSSVFFLYLLVPIAALLFHAPPSEIWAQMKQPDVIEALKLSFYTTAITTVITVIFGLPAAIVLVKGNFPGHRLLETLATLPTVLPPTVAGLALLLAYGRTGLVGKHLERGRDPDPVHDDGGDHGAALRRGAVLREHGAPGLAQLGDRYENAAYTLRASRFQAFRHVVLPLTSPVAAHGHRACLGARPRRVRGDDHLRRELPGHDADAADRGLHRVTVELRQGDRGLGDPARGLLRGADDAEPDAVVARAEVVALRIDGAAVLDAHYELTLGSFHVDLSLDSKTGETTVRPRRERLGEEHRPEAALGPARARTFGSFVSTTSCTTTPQAKFHVPAEEQAGRLRLPGLRALSAPVGVRQRRVRAEDAGRREGR